MQHHEPSRSSERSVREEMIAASHPLRAAETTGAHDFFGEPFQPRRPFLGGHAQTIAGNFLPRRNELPAPEERLIRVEPEVQVLCHCHWQAERAGMNVVRMNMRNCGGTEQLGPTLYNSSMSADVGMVAETLIREEGLQK